jgi:hypothetical protein
MSMRGNEVCRCEALRQVSADRETNIAGSAKELMVSLLKAIVTVDGALGIDTMPTADISFLGWISAAAASADLIAGKRPLWIGGHEEHPT